MNGDCIFCKIIRGEVPSFKVWEDEEFMAILDIFPNTPGMTVLLTKKHYGPYFEEMPDEAYQRFFLAAKKVSHLLDKKLGSKKTAMVLEGMGVNHAHVKLYPMHGFDEEWIPESKEEKFYQKYPGFVDSHKGPRISDEELKKIAEKIKNN